MALGNKNIVLVGFMGVGKSLISNDLCKILKRKVFSIDRLIEVKEKSKIKTIFAKKGEVYFRRLERAMVQRVSKLNNAVIDCGGGVVLDRRNMKDLKKNGIIFHLYASPKVIFKRIKGQKHRPLVNVKNPLKRITAILKARKPFYAQADYAVDSNPADERVVSKEIIRILNHE